MMTMSDRNEYVGANIEPAVKHALRERVQHLKTTDKDASMSKFVNEAIREKLERDGVSIATPQPANLGEILPFGDEKTNDASGTAGNQ